MSNIARICAAFRFGAISSSIRTWRLAWVGAKDEALGGTGRLFRLRSSMMAPAASDPAFVSIRKEPRFELTLEICRCP